MFRSGYVNTEKVLYCESRVKLIVEIFAIAIKQYSTFSVVTYPHLNTRGLGEFEITASRVCITFENSISNPKCLEAAM